ncbi:MAG: energy transducer TonB [Sphingomicrobium sp.]
MLAYAAHRRQIAEHTPAPHVMLGIAAAHIALIAAVMSAKLDLPQRIFDRPIRVTLVPIPTPPPEHAKPVDQRPSNSSDSHRIQQIVPLRQPDDHPLDAQPIVTPDAGPGGFGPIVEPQPVLDPVRTGPRFATPPSAIRPPYPASKISSQEEALLKLRLSIDPRGRVVAVEPVGRADPAFLAAARRHLLAYWRYTPATEDGRAIASATVITLRFELD